MGRAARIGLVEKLAVRAKADKLKGLLVRLAIDQDEVWSDMAVAMAFPLMALGALDATRGRPEITLKWVKITQKPEEAAVITNSAGGRRHSGPASARTGHQPVKASVAHSV